MSRPVRWADSAGVIGAVFAALCCAGTPVILSVLAALGLSAVRNDAILLPLLVLSLGTALWGFWIERRIHGVSGPLALAGIGATALVAGVVFVHGPPARLLIDAGALALVAATLWNIRARTARRAGSRCTQERGAAGGARGGRAHHGGRVPHAQT